MSPILRPLPSQNSLAVYIHWPFCKAKCPYCDFNSHVREGIDQEHWRRALLSELRHQAVQVPGRRVTSVFFGGGTPSLMEAATVEALLAEIHQIWPATENPEVTLEANPTSVEAGKFRDYKAAGVNRVSLGVQSLRADALRFLGRAHSAREALAAVELAANLFDRYSFDLIYTRPGQTVKEWENELAEAIPYMRDHLSLYQLTIEENTAFHHAYHVQRAFTLPEEESAAEMYALTQTMLEAAGLPAYEISNHARPGAECRHNLAYWRGEEYAGIGPGAHGRLNLADERLATLTLKSPERWLERVACQGHGLESSVPLSASERLEETLLMGLRLREGMVWERLEDASGKTREIITAHPDFMRLQEQGLVEWDTERLFVTAAGRPVLTALTGQLHALFA